MGLGIVEFAMAIEERFDVAIRDEDAARITTLRDLIDWLEGTLARRTGVACRSQHAFYRVRRAVLDVTLIERARLRPSIRWDELFPAYLRARLWKRIGNAGRFRLPRLECPYVPWMWSAIAAVAIGVSAWAQCQPHTTAALAAAQHVLIVSVFCIACMLGGLAIAASRLAWKVPRYCTTLGDAALIVAAQEPSPGHRRTAWTRRTIAAAVERELRAVFKVDDFDEEARIVDLRE